jgi:hypothetical protein
MIQISLELELPGVGQTILFVTLCCSYLAIIYFVRIDILYAKSALNAVEFSTQVDPPEQVWCQITDAQN